VLTSRRGPDAPGADELRAEIESLGAGAPSRPATPPTRDAVAALLAHIAADARRCAAVVHAAGYLERRRHRVPGRRPAWSRCCAPAVAASVRDELTRAWTSTRFVLFSFDDSAPPLRRPGRGKTYAACNAFLDAHCGDDPPRYAGKFGR